jgi:hypothetical protein
MARVGGARRRRQGAGQLECRRRSAQRGPNRHGPRNRRLSDQVLLQHAVLVLRVGPELEVITTDHPLVVNAGREGFAIHLLALALDPSTLVFMHDASMSLEQDELTAAILKHTPLLLKGPCRCVYSRGPLRDWPALSVRQVAYRHMMGKAEDLET